MDRVLREATIDGHAAGTMPLGDTPEVQASGVHAEYAILTASTTMVRFDRNAIADVQFVNCWSERDDGAGPFMPRRELAIRWLMWKWVRLNFQIGTARAAHRHFDQYFTWSGLRDGFVDD